jgi:hypothetical protein
MKPAQLAYLPDQFWNDGIYDGCMPITKRYGLHPDNQHGEMDAAVRDLLMGRVVPGEFAKHLLNRINNSGGEDCWGKSWPIISEATAERIANDIKKQVLAPLSEILLAANPGWQTWLLR